MFRNYLTVALRNLFRHKLYSVINIAGLAVGLACVLFIILFARDELSYDKWVPDSANLYRLELTIHAAGSAAAGNGRDPVSHAGGHARRNSGRDGHDAPAGGTDDAHERRPTVSRGGQCS